MKKLLLSCMLLCAFSCLSIDAKIAGNWFSNADQTIVTNAPVTFNGQNFQDNLLLLADNQTIQFNTKGSYLVSFTGTGILSPAIQGAWSLGLYLNGVLVPGSVAASSSGTNQATTGILPVVGQVILNAKKGDILQILNTTSATILLAGSASGNALINNSSATLVIEILQADPKHNHKHKCKCHR